MSILQVPGGHSVQNGGGNMFGQNKCFLWFPMYCAYLNLRVCVIVRLSWRGGPKICWIIGGQGQPLKPIRDILMFWG